MPLKNPQAHPLPALQVRVCSITAVAYAPQMNYGSTGPLPELFQLVLLSHTMHISVGGALNTHVSVDKFLEVELRIQGHIGAF